MGKCKRLQSHAEEVAPSPVARREPTQGFQSFILCQSLGPTELPASHLHLDARLSMVHQHLPPRCAPPSLPLLRQRRHQHRPLAPESLTVISPGTCLSPVPHSRWVTVSILDLFVVRTIPCLCLLSSLELPLVKTFLCFLTHWLPAQLAQWETLEGDGRVRGKEGSGYFFLSLSASGTSCAASVAPAPLDSPFVWLLPCAVTFSPPPTPDLKDLVSPAAGVSLGSYFGKSPHLRRAALPLVALPPQEVYIP